MSTDPRQELAAVIRSVTDGWDEPLDEVHDITPIVNAVVAAGWVSPEDHRAEVERIAGRFAAADEMYRASSRALRAALAEPERDEEIS